MAGGGAGAAGAAATTAGAGAAGAVALGAAAFGTAAFGTAAFGVGAAPCCSCFKASTLRDSSATLAALSLRSLARLSADEAAAPLSLSLSGDGKADCLRSSTEACTLP